MNRHEMEFFIVIVLQILSILGATVCAAMVWLANLDPYSKTGTALVGVLFISLGIFSYIDMRDLVESLKEQK